MTKSTLPSREFIAAMNAKGEPFGINFNWLRAQPTKVLIDEISSLIDGNPDCYVKKHKADALAGELKLRSDFRRPWTSKESRVMQWLDTQQAGRSGNV